MVLKSGFNEDVVIRDGEQRSFAYFSSDWKYRWSFFNKKISSDGNGFDNFSDLQEILHQKMYFASNFIFWIEIGWVIGYLARRGER